MKNMTLVNITSTNSTLIKVHNFSVGMIEDLTVSSIHYESSQKFFDFLNFENLTINKN